MKLAFRDIPIQRKLMTIILLISGAVLLLTCSAFFAYELVTFRHTTVRQLSTLAKVIASNSTASLAFQNPDDAQEILAAVKAERHILAAGLYDNAGNLFAKYPEKLPADVFPAAPEPDGYRFSRSYLTGFQPVVQGPDQRLGTLYLKSDLGEMYERFRLYGIIVVAVITVSFVLAWMLSKMLQQQISEPILALAGTAKAISTRGDYSVRATKLGKDELGLLTDAFNQMLTQIAKQDKALREGTENVRAVLNSAISAVIVMDAESKITDWNARAEKMFGLTHLKALGREMAEMIIAPHYRETVRCEMERFVATGEGSALNRLIEMSALRQDSSDFPVELSISPIKTDEVVKFCCFITDITERKRSAAALQAKQEAESANKAKSEFLSRMSHELRTPLNAILGFGQLLERHNPTEIQRLRVNHITTAGHHLLKLINEVLDISRIESGNLQLSLEPVSIADVLRETLDLMRPLATQRLIELSAASCSDTSSFVLADRQRLIQVILNLVANALKYTPEGGVVTVSCSSGTSDTLRLAIRDTGPGIAPEKLTRLFTPFDRLGAEQSSVEGTGLGLALSQRLIEAMSGSVGVESTVGAGSTFWLELPCVAPRLVPAPAQEQHMARPHSTGSSGRRTVLYIEDNLSNLTLVQEIVAEQPDIELLTAMQAQLGLDMARKHRPDLILLDLHLPDLAGPEVLAELRRYETTRDIPVVVISADATERQIDRLMTAGAHAYLTKPLDVAEFLRVMEEALFENGTKAKTEHPSRVTENLTNKSLSITKSPDGRVILT
jgi:PAS domain S-box-containing protein